MKLSPRQLLLIQGAAKVLIDNLELTHAEVLALIAARIRSELLKMQITMEDLNLKQRSERTTFIRHVVAGVHSDLRMKNLWSEKELEVTIKKFMEILHESWEKENENQ